MSKPIIHFSHGNSFPAGTYRQYLDLLGDDFDVRAVDMYGHDPEFPVTDGWTTLAAQLIAQVEGYGAPAILVGHSLGGILSVMAARHRPELARCVVMLDSPVVAGWRAAFWRMVKWQGWASRISPARLSRRRRTTWPDRAAAFAHFSSKPVFAALAPGVLDDYLDCGLEPAPDGGVQLRFSREIESEIYNALPHHLGDYTQARYPVPVGFIAGTRSNELRQAGLGATRRLVGERLVEIEGSHLFPLESPARTAQLTRAMIADLLEQGR
ncbi:MAG: alpha/beta fold hydrolase [Gammaproteobacteria bacterium]